MAIPSDKDIRALRAALETAQKRLRAYERTEAELTAAKNSLEAKTRELALSLSMLQATLEASTDGILVTDLEGRVTGFNQRFTRMWRIPGELMDRADHGTIQRLVADQLARPDEYLAETAEIYAKQPAESFDIVELLDGRVFERISKLQLVGNQSVGRVWSLRDITARRQAARVLREQQEWFEVTLSSIGDAVITTDTDGNVTFLNPVAEAMTGWKLSEAVSQPLTRVFNIINEETRSAAEAPVQRVLAEGAIVGLANHTALISRDGRETAIEDSAAPIRNPAGKIVGAVVVFHDVTERRRNESALRLSHAQFSAIIQQSPIGMYLVDSSLVLRQVNAKAEPVFGAISDLIGRDLETILRIVWPEPVASEVLGRFRDTLSTGEPFFSRAFSEIRADRRVREYYNWEIHRVTMPDGQHGVVCYFIDISEHVLAEEKLRKLADEQKRTTEALREEYAIVEHLNGVSRALATELEVSRIAQIVAEASTRIIRAQFGAFHYSRRNERGEVETIHERCGESSPAASQFPQWSATILSDPAFRKERVIRVADVTKDSRFRCHAPSDDRPAGDPPAMSYLAVRVISRSGTALGELSFGHTAPDVFTERDEQILLAIAAQAAAAMDTAHLYETEQQARNAAELARNEAEQASRAKDEFLAALSHELRTPLTPVLAILSDLPSEPALPEALAADFEMMRRNVELEARLIDDLLDLTRVTHGKLELHWEEVELGQLLENALTTCLPELRAKQLTLHQDLSDLPQVVVADGARITQVLWNILKNAVKFTPRGGSITLRSGITVTDRGRMIFIDCQDTGIGIEPDQIGGIFAAFEQGGRAITKQFGGLGLGLAISKAIAEAHRGSISVSSEGSGRGSSFKLMLPCRQAVKPNPRSAPASTASDGRAAGADVAVPARATRRILLVEDHTDTAATLSRMLVRSGYVVAHADTMQKALQLAERAKDDGGFALVVSDIGLPDGTGVELMRQLSTTYGLSGIALSGFGMEADREGSKAAGFAKHLIKPVNVDVLRAAIAELLVERGGNEKLPPVAPGKAPS